MIYPPEAKTKNPVLTIIIATYNASRYIHDCLHAIAENVAEPYELIIVDGQSKDDTLEIIRNFKGIAPLVISEPDKGIYDAMNKGLKCATGKWVLFLGADDRILPSFSSIFPQLKDASTIYYGNCVNEDHALGGTFSAYKLAKMNLCHQAILYPRQVFEAYNFSLKYPVFADYLLNIQCWGDSAFTKKYLNINIAYYNMEGFSSTANDPDFRRDKPFFIRKYLGHIIYFRYRFRKFKESRRPGSRFF
ncbi:glycosyltransferase family 2 protein [Pedobacter sp. GR22-6]|uniref:glycosyltransferase family 2 protein n=1 Tax=Pedobacter sp. GR22-6 TaxID=3127957 RepID=UPI00307F8918